MRTSEPWGSGLRDVLRAQGRLVTSEVQLMMGSEALGPTYLLQQVLVCPHEYLLFLYPRSVLQETRGVYLLMSVLAKPPTPREGKVTDIDSGAM